MWWTDPTVVAAIIAGSVAVAGFVIQGLFITRYIDKQKLIDVKSIEAIKQQNEVQLEAIKQQNDIQLAKITTQLSTEASKKLEEYRAELLKQQEARTSRFESLTALLTLAEASDEAARNLCMLPEIDSNEGRVKAVTKALQSMSPFFESLSKVDPKKTLTKDDRAEAKRIQEQLVTILLKLKLELDPDREEYRGVLDQTYDKVAESVQSFRLYIENVIVS
jgi:hypothetical protein